MQVMCQSQYATGGRSFQEQHEHLRRGDVIGIVGVSGRSALIRAYAYERSFLAEPARGGYPKFFSSLFKWIRR